MKRARAALLLVTSTLALGASASAVAQLAEEGTNDLGKRYKIFIYEKRSLGDGRWEFQTKTVGDGMSKPYYSDWKVADCWRSTIDGKLVTAVRRGTWNDDGILKAVCGVR